MQTDFIKRMAAALIIVSAAWVSGCGGGDGGDGGTTVYRTITWDLVGGAWQAGFTPTTRVADGESLGEPAAPEKDGNDFDGWYTEAAPTDKVVFPVTVTADMTLFAKWTDGGDTPGGGTVRIAVAADMEKLRTDPGGNFVLDNDIALSGQWQPIFTFTGKLDGQGHKITGLNLAEDGMFIMMENAEIKHLIIEDGVLNTSEGQYHGMLAGRAENCVVDDVHIVGGSITCSRSSSLAGGLIAWIAGSGATVISNCSVGASVKAGENAGGITAYTNSRNLTITGCWVTGSVTGGRGSTSSNYTYAGGIIGQVISGKAAVSKCGVFGKVRNAAVAGGIIGFVNSGGVAEASIDECFSNEEVSCARSVGGIVGRAQNTDIRNCYSIGQTYGGGQETYRDAAGGIGGDLRLCTITNCYAIGTISGRYAGGIAGRAYETDISNCIAMASGLGDMLSVKGRIVAGGSTPWGTVTNNYANSAIAWGNDDKNGFDGQGYPIDTYGNLSFYTTNLPSWDFTNVWEWYADGYTPMLKWFEDLNR